MKALRYLGVVQVVLAVLLGVAAAEEPERPNILFLLADDQRPDTIAAHGNPHIETPNLDRLVREGVSFRNNYCMGSMHGAVCQPSRAMMMSGRSLYNIPMKLEGVPILPELLRDEGYTTFGTGKWHNDAPAYIRGFEKAEAVLLGGMSDHTLVPVQDLSPDGEFVNQREETTFSSELFANAAINFLERHNGEKPFFAYVAFTAPHDTRNPPTPYRERYYGKLPPLPPNFMPQHPFDNGRMIVRDENLAAWPRTEEVVRDQLAEYYGLVTHLDEQIGRILETLEARGFAENTLIVYAADHGLAMGSHGLLGKQNLYEHSMGAPLIFSGLDIPKGQDNYSFTYLMDIMPTLCGVAGVTPPDNVEGKDLRPLWRGAKILLRDSIFLTYEDSQRALREGDWKLIRYPKIDHVQLFNLAEDPHELNNLADFPEHAGKVEAMMEKLAAWQRQVNDDAPLHVKKPKNKEIDLTGHPREPDQWQPAWIVEKYFAQPAE